MSNTPPDTTAPAPAAFDWCAEAARLRQVLTDVASGNHVVRGRNRQGEDEREMQFAEPNLPLLQRMLADAEKKCAISRGEAVPKRYAITPRAGRRGLLIY